LADHQADDEDKQKRHGFSSPHAFRAPDFAEDRAVINCCETIRRAVS
jgi:hypothetical protein